MSGVDPLRLDARAGRPFSGYALESLLGQGGMGAVYRARHVESGAVVALKTLRSDRRGGLSVERFRREVRVQAELGELSHVVSVVDPGGEAEGLLFFSMQLLEGGSLAEARGRLSVRERVLAMAQAARGVGHAHTRGYVHRDLKPENVLLDAAGVAHVTDFGLAKSVLGQTKLTQTGALLGTPSYMSPEHPRVGPPGDVWSLGAMLYELVTEEVPFEGRTPMELFAKIASEAPARFSERGVSLPGLEAIVFKCLEKEPALRYPDADALAEDLERFLAGEAPRASSSSWVDRLAARAARQWRLALGAVLGLLMAAGVALVGRGWVDARHQGIGEMRQALAGRELARELQGELDPAALDEVLARAEAALSGGEADAEALQPALVDALLRRARRHLSERRRSAARQAWKRIDQAARWSAEEVAAVRAPGPARVAIARLRVQAQAQLEVHPREALQALRDLAGDDPYLVWWDVRLLLWAGQDVEASQLLSVALRADPGGQRAALLLLQAIAASRAGEQEQAQAAIRTARDAGASLDDVLRGLLDHDLFDPAIETLLELLEDDPRPEYAQLLTALCLRRGRPYAALAALDGAAAQSPDPVLAVELLRVRLHLGEDGAAKELEGLDAPQAAILTADLRAVDEGPRAYRDLPVSSPQARAARVRALLGSDPGAAKVELEALTEELGETVVDRILPPQVSRWARDLALAWREAGEPGRAREVVALAGRSRALDETSWTEDPKKLLEGVGRLDGALGRGLVLARVAERWGSDSLKARAERLLRVSVAERPGLRPALKALAGGALPEAWSAYLSGGLSRPATSAEGERMLPEALLVRAGRMPPGDPGRAALERAALVAGHPDALRRDIDRQGGKATSWEEIEQRMRYLRARPHAAFQVLQLIPGMHEVPKRRQDLLTKFGGAAAWFVGLVARDTSTWGRDDGGEGLLKLADGLVLADPGLIGLFYLRAFVATVLGQRERARRDLEVLEALPAVREDDGFWRALQLVWRLSRSLPQSRAAEALERLPPPRAILRHELEVLERWRRDRPGPFALRQDEVFVRWFDALTIEAPSEREGPATILALDFERDLLGRPGGEPLEVRGAERAPGRVGFGLHVTKAGGLRYDGRAFDPREGTFMAWVRPDWSSAEDAEDDHGIFGWFPQEWKSELRLWVWHRREVSCGAHAPPESKFETIYSGVRPTRGTWLHVAWTWSVSGGRAVLYVDGRERAVGPYAFPALPELTAPLWVGTLLRSTGWEGTLDEVRIAARAYSAEEVRRELERAD